MPAYEVEQLISTAQKRKEQAEAADKHNREEANEDLLFAVLKQWDESVISAAKQPGMETPPTPHPVVDRLTAFRNQVVNEIRQAKPSPNVTPRGNGANKQTAEVIEGKVRDILYDSDSDLAFIEAAKYAVACSRGSFRLDPEVVDEDTGQQVLRVNPIWDPSSVYSDPFAKRPDKSDAKWKLVINVISRIEFKERWPNAKATAADFFDKDRSAPGWMDPSGDKESVMVAEYWCVEKIGDDSVALDKYDDEDYEWPDAKKYPKDRNDSFKARQKERGETHQVVCHLIDGVEELEPPSYRPGKVIPIFDVEGDSYWVDGKRYTLSLTRPARDMQRVYNWLAKKKIEILGVQSNAPFWATPKQAENHANEWNSANNTNKFFLLYNHDPNAPGPPQRQSIDAPIQAVSEAEMSTAQEMKDAIGLQDPNLSGAQSKNQSGLAITKLISQGNVATFHYQDNLARTMRTFCEVLVDWLPYYHDIEQEMEILKADMKKEKVMVNTDGPYTDPETGKSYQHDLTKGKYSVVVNIGPSFAAARQQSAQFYTTLVGAQPEAFWIIGDMLIRSQDDPGADEAADRVKRAIALKMPGLIQDDPNQQLPAGANAQMQQMTMQMQQLQQVVQQQGIALKTQAIPHQIKAESAMQTEQLKSKTTIQKALIDAIAKLHAAKADHDHKMYQTHLKEATDAVEHLMTMMHESELAPGPDQGPQGLHPTAIPQPVGPNGAPAVGAAQ